MQTQRTDREDCQPLYRKALARANGGLQSGAVPARNPILGNGLVSALFGNQALAALMCSGFLQTGNSESPGCGGRFRGYGNGMIKGGASDAEILDANPEYFNQIDRMDKVRQTILQEQYRDKERTLETVYIFGKTGAGKTRHVLDKHGYKGVYRVTNYKHPFDAYKSEDVIVFEEFRSSLPVSDMLNYLDRYPLSLPCRYNDKTACYTKVYILTNIDLLCQYKDAQRHEPETWKANKVICYDADGIPKEYPVKDYLDAFHPESGVDGSPFGDNKERI